MASATLPNPALSRYGPSWPNPDSRTRITSGFAAASSAGPRPRRSRVPGRKPSTTTSLLAARASTRSRPAGTRRSTVTDLFPRPSERHSSEVSAPKVCHWRDSSPVPGRSTFTTSAPNAARMRPAVGAAT